MRNGFWLGLVLLAVHLAVCGGIWLLAWAKVLEVEGYFAPVMLLVPLWGPLCVLLLHTSNRLTGGCLREQTLEKLHINEEIHKSILVADDEGEDMVVPLEEALLVDSPAQKRKLILSVLTDDPAGYYDLLQQARMDNDSEVVHYASTALSQITKEADLKLQKLEQRYAAAPDDAAVLEEYCNYLESYLKDMNRYDINATDKQEVFVTEVNQLLEYLLQEGQKLVGKPAGVMNKEEKLRFLKYLNDKGAFLITKSGERIQSFLGISKYTMYTYLDMIKKEEAGTKTE